MLVLTRKVGESLVLTISAEQIARMAEGKHGVEIIVCQDDIQGNRSKLAIDAPPEVIVKRGELIDADEYGIESVVERSRRNRARRRDSVSGLDRSESRKLYQIGNEASRVAHYPDQSTGSDRV